MKFVQNSKQVWRHYSTQALGLGLAIQVGWPALNAIFEYPPVVGKWVGIVCGVVLAWGLLGKFIDQKFDETE